MEESRLTHDMHAHVSRLPDLAKSLTGDSGDGPFGQRSTLNQSEWFLSQGSSEEVATVLKSLVHHYGEHLSQLTSLHNRTLEQLREDLALWMGSQSKQELSSPCDFSSQQQQSSSPGDLAEESHMSLKSSATSAAKSRFSEDDRDVGEIGSLGTAESGKDLLSPGRFSAATMETTRPSGATGRFSERFTEEPSGDVGFRSTVMSAQDINAATKGEHFEQMNLNRDKRLRIAVKRSKSELMGADNRLSRFVRTSRFDQLSSFLVIANAAFIGVQVELMFNTTHEPDPIMYIDCTFCTCFLIELALRLYTFGRREYFFGADLCWNWFDFVIVTFSALDTFVSVASQGQPSALGSISVLRTVRILRVTRALRIIRVLKFFKDLRIMIAAIISTLKTAAWAFLLLLIAMYVFGIAIAQVAAEHKQEKAKDGIPLSDSDPLLTWFGSLPQSLFTLFMAISGGIDYEISATPLEKLPLALVIYIFFIIFSTFCVMNVMTGIFCQNAIETFETDKENVIECQLAEKERFVATLASMFKDWDTQGDGVCTREEFEAHIKDQDVQILLRTLDIDARDAMQLFSMLDAKKSGYVDLEEFVHGCITLRGGAKAVHMERAIIDSKLTNTKLDAVMKTLKELRGGLANLNLGNKFASRKTKSFGAAKTKTFSQGFGSDAERISSKGGRRTVQMSGAEYVEVEESLESPMTNSPQHSDENLEVKQVEPPRGPVKVSEEVPMPFGVVPSGMLESVGSREAGYS